MASIWQNHNPPQRCSVAFECFQQRVALERYYRPSLFISAHTTSHEKRRATQENVSCAKLAAHQLPQQQRKKEQEETNRHMYSVELITGRYNLPCLPFCILLLLIAKHVC